MALKSAFSAFNEDTWAVGLSAYMTPRSTDHPSNGQWLSRQFNRFSRKDFDDIITCDIIMAAKLMRPDAY